MARIVRVSRSRHFAEDFSSPDLAHLIISTSYQNTTIDTEAAPLYSPKLFDVSSLGLEYSAAALVADDDAGQAGRG